MTSGYGSAAAYRQALEHRLRRDAEAGGRDLNWLRRRHTFVRLLHRLAATQPDLWALKGGLAVELRRPGLARATRDVDLAMRSADVVDAGDPDALTNLLRAALDTDPDGDQFAFVLSAPDRMSEDSYGRPAWRFRVTATLAGRTFAETRLDVVVRPEELTGLSTAQLPTGVTPPPDARPRQLVVTDLRQQFAEKLHAITRVYATGESSRVKDLLDMVLLLEDGLSCDADLVRVARRVFAVRATHPLPEAIGPPPTSWRQPYLVLASELAVTPTDVDEAGRLITTAWHAALTSSPREEDSDATAP